MQKNEIELVEVKEKLASMKNMFDTIQITTDEELNGVADKIKEVKILLKLVEKTKERFTEPAKLIIGEAREIYDPMIKWCRNAEEVLKQRAKAYMTDKEQKRLADEAKIAAKVESGYMKPETAAAKIETLAEAPRTVRTDNSGLRMSKRKVAKIINPELVPREFWVIDEVRVRREALDREKNGLPPIPGVIIEEESSIASI